LAREREEEMKNSVRLIFVVAVLLAGAALVLCSRIIVRPKVVRAESGQGQIHPAPGNPCYGKKHIVGYGIPRDAPSEITRAINAGGVIICVGTKPNAGICHIEMAESGLKRDLHMKDSMSAGSKDDTFTFTCGSGTTLCGITQCD
jgi:hypothetical protein